MNVGRIRIGVLSVVLCLIAVSPTAIAQTQHAAGQRPAIYDTKANGEKQIADALKIAQRDNKRVLLQFGANWCGWCHKLHDLFKTNRDVAHTLLYEYELVLVDVDKVDGRTHNAAVNEKYGNPIKHGLPALVVLDANGKQLTTKDTGELEQGDHHDPAKVLAFLKAFKPQPQNANEVLSTALAKAKKESKSVFVYFSAPWCGWCHKLTNWLGREDVAAIFGRAYTVVNIDVDRMTGGKELDTKYRGKTGGGIPFFAILDTSGAKLADSIGPKGNVGFPVEPYEVAHFIDMVKKTASKKLSNAQIAQLQTTLGKKVKG